MAYIEQFERVCRFLDRVGNMRRDSFTYDDDLWSFFQHCHHLRDWVVNDPAIDDSVKDTIIARAGSTPELRVCADLADGTKHATMHRKNAKPVIRNVTVGGDWLQEWIIRTPAADYTSHELAAICVAKWRDILDEAGLAH